MAGKIDTTKPLKQGDLAEALGTRASTLKFYTQLGLLPFTVAETGRKRFYDYTETKKRLAEIEKLKKKGMKMADIVKLWAEQGKLFTDGMDMTMFNLTMKGKQ